MSLYSRIRIIVSLNKWSCRPQKLLAEILSEKGYNPILASDGSEALRERAFDFLEHPFEEEEFFHAIERAFDFASLRLQISESKASYSKKLVQFQERERKRLSQEIHDDMGQLLTVLNMDVKWLSKKLTQEAPF